jgi:predicted MFS family arabinose efflux permease
VNAGTVVHRLPAASAAVGSRRPPAGVRAGSARALNWVIGASALTTTGAVTLNYLLLDQVRRTLEVSLGEIHWILVLALIVATPGSWLICSLSPLLGARKLLVLVTLSCAAGTAICANAPNFKIFFVGQILTSAALVSSGLCLVLLRDRRASGPFRSGLGRFVALQAIGAGVAFVLGGLLRSTSGTAWRLSYWLLALCFVALAILVATVLPLGRRSATSRPDLGGAVLLLIGLSGVLLAIGEGRAWRWTSDRGIALAFLALVTLAGGGAIEWRSRRALLKVTLLRDRAAAAGSVIVAVVAGLVVTAVITVPAFFQSRAVPGGRPEISTLRVGLYLLPLGAAGACSAYLCGRWIGRVRPESVAATSLSCSTLAFLLLTRLHASPGEIVTLIALVGAGCGGALVVAYDVTLSNRAPRESGAAIGLAFALGGSGATAAGAAVAAALANHLIGVGHGAYPGVSGFTGAWSIGAAMGVLGILACALTPARSWAATEYQASRVSPTSPRRF